jgi:arachidonate 15-lipoxygenase
MWWLRRAFWNRFMIFKFRHNKPMVIPVPQTESRPLVPVPIQSKFPYIAVRGIDVADRIPRDEVQSLALRFCKLQAALSRVFSPMQAGLPPIDADPDVALAAAYTPGHRQCFPAPLRPGAYEGDVDLGHLAVASPYACYLEQDGNGGYRWDLTALDQFECQPGLRSPSALVEFAVDPSARFPRPYRIDCELGSCKPGDHDWVEARRIAMCALSTHLSLVRHFNWVHLVCGDPLALVTRNCLPVEHPIRRLLHPHVYATQSSDEMVTIVQMSIGGDFENTFSFTHDGICKLFEATCGDFDLRMIEPLVDAGRRGVSDVPFETPAFANRVALMNVIRNHVSRYLSLYFDSDAALAGDEAFGQWLDALRLRIPHGVGEIAGSPVTIEGAVRLLSTFIYLTTVEHEIVDAGVWNYQLWSDVQPSRIYTSGLRQPLDVFQRFIYANFTFQIPRTLLMNDFSSLALDQRGAAAFRAFLHDLAGLQALMDGQPAACWRIEPRNLKANINA